MQPSVEHRIDRLVERHPAQLDLGLLVGAVVHGGRGREAARLEEVDDLVAAARRGVERDRIAPLGGDEVGLFGEFALARRASGDSPSTSSRPAGISQSRVRIGCRYWLISSTRSWSSIASTATAPGCVDVLARDRAAAEFDGLAIRRPRPFPRRPSRHPGSSPGRASRAAARSLRPRRAGWPIGVGAGSAVGDAASRRAARPDARPARRPRTGATPAGARARRRPARGTAGAGGSAATAAPGAPGCRRRTGGPSRGSSTYSTSSRSGETPENTMPGRRDAGRGSGC